MVKENEAIKEHVRKSYSKVAKRAQMSDCSCSCCGSDTNADSIGYDMSELKDLPESTIQACAGCGNPTAIAGLRKGEVVLDLGSGGGIDVFLAARKVGSKGRAIGVDMTQDMIDLARKNADLAGFDNVEFRLGDIEDLPVDSDSIDVIISNCVINLAPDKDKVFKEAYRVLKSRGRIMVSDIVTRGELPKEIREDPDAWASCVAGALDEDVYIEKLKSAGFEDVKVISKTPFMDIVSSAQIEARKP